MSGPVAVFDTPSLTTYYVSKRQYTIQYNSERVKTTLSALSASIITNQSLFFNLVIISIISVRVLFPLEHIWEKYNYIKG